MPVDLGTLPRVDPKQLGAVGGRDRSADRTVALSYTDAVIQTACWEERSQVCNEIRLTLAEVRRRTPSAVSAWGPRGTTPRLTVRGTTAGAPPPPPPPPPPPHITSPQVNLTARQVTSRHVTSPHLTSRYVTPLHLTSPHLTSLHVTSRPLPSSPHPLIPSPKAGQVWCGVVWYGVVWCGVVWCAEGAVTRRQWPGCLPTGTGKRVRLCVLWARRV